MIDRRTFLHMLGLATGTAALSSCTSEKEQNRLISQLVPPEEGVTPGEARWHPGSCTECPAGCGMQVRLRDGWPVKLEGVADHPVNRGGLCMRGQAALWRLYHPQRLQAPMQRLGGEFRAVSWDQAFAQILAALEEARRSGRHSLYLAGRSTGSLATLLGESCAAMGMERLPEFEPFSHAALRQANHLLFARGELPHFRTDRADGLFTLGADLLETFVTPVGFARQFADRAGRRWWHAEPHFSLTGANADTRLPLRPGSEPHLLAWLLRRLGEVSRRPLPAALAAALPAISDAEAAAATGLAPAQLEELAAGLRRAQEPLVLAGGVATGQECGLAAAVLAGLLQWTLGATGKTVDFSRAENYAGVGSLLDLQRLAGRLERGEVGVLVVARANPLFHAPLAWNLAGEMRGARLRVGLADFLDETQRELDLILPLSHSLESWGDLEPRRGVRGLIRPVLSPLHDTRSEGDILLELQRRSGSPGPGSYRDYLFAQWRRRFDEQSLRAFTETGFVEEPLAQTTVALDAPAAAGFLRGLRLPPPAEPPVLVIAPSIRRFDGRSRPLDLLEEIPDPLTTVTYGAWVSVSPLDAGRLKLAERDELRLSHGSWSALLPAKVQPGLAPGVFVVQRDLLPAFPGGADPASGEALCCLPGLRLEKSGRRVQLPILAGSPSQHGRGIIPDPLHRREEHQRISLYPEHAHPEHRWGMAIDLALCIGCGACAAACHVENNVPVVGPADHLKGREMSWLRIEPFYDEAGAVEFIPMLCQHCHSAPCETVCPVYAAYHNPEGLNVQVYNRCIGTRYCSHNCPYKVRRFNWWEHRLEKPLERMRNPDLSQRTRGMMEKCTFCIQRIRAAKDKARDEARPVRDGEVVTACAQSCPTSAIVFGDLNDKVSRVARLVQSERGYRVFEQLGTEPSVWYLKKVRPET
ncbi:MAG: 4Fe-4S dicluster domain-containing protein [Geobacteraceae bacterium]|nr:4Fe-4S dicluster domain-containing protein [Geobacteraceae bacterium]